MSDEPPEAWRSIPRYRVHGAGSWSLNSTSRGYPSRWAKAALPMSWEHPSSSMGTAGRRRTASCCASRCRPRSWRRSRYGPLKSARTTNPTATNRTRKSAKDATTTRCGRGLCTRSGSSQALCPRSQEIRSKRANMSAKKLCFVVSPIGAVDSEPRIHANWVLKYMIELALGQYRTLKFVERGCRCEARHDYQSIYCRPSACRTSYS